MCAIAGIISQDKRKINLDDLRIMADSLKHRGPDDEGFLLLDNVGFVHKRLSIIDLVTGHQPMSNEDKSIWIVYNGEIYNYIELRSELIAKGYSFRTNSDTEVIIRLYEEYGYEALYKLNGMFAFTIYDRNKDRIFAARDHLGVKPYYYVFNDKEFIFASEIKAILKIRKSYKKENPLAIYDYIVFQFCLGDKTFFKDIKKLLPGHYLILENISRRLKLNIRKYWDLDFVIDKKHREDYFIKRVPELIKDAVRLQLRSDVPLGCHLSGGMDSSIITCIAAKLSDLKIKTFTAFFSDGAEYDESRYAKLVSRFAKTEYFEIRLAADDFKKSISRIIYLMDEPVAGPGIFPQYYVCRLASQNVKVVLGGQGGDEIFGGYIRYFLAYFAQAIKREIFQEKIDEDAISLESIIPNLSLLRRYEPLLQNFFSSSNFGDLTHSYFHLINRSQNAHIVYAPELLDTRLRYDVFASFEEEFNAPNTKSYINKMLNFDIKNSLPALLHVEDRTSMAFSLESRVPLLDYRIAELVAHVPVQIKLKGCMSKYLLKKACKGIIPHAILARTDKMGFPVPLVEWFKAGLNPFVRDILLSSRAKSRGTYNVKRLEEVISGEGKFDRQVWGLLCLELWFREFIDRGAD